MSQAENAYMQMARIRAEKSRQSTTFNLTDKVKAVTISRGQSKVLADVKGTGFISQLWSTFTGWFWRSWDPDQPVNPSILKTLIIKIYWDGESKPAICAPAGDFFGNGLCQMESFCSDHLGMSSGGFYCKLPMPFRTGFKVEFENRDPELEAVVFLNVLYQLTTVPPDCGYLHAQFHTGRNPGPEPVTIARAEGTGHYAGCTLAMQGQDLNYLAFLEAPEYVFIDGDKDTPTMTGTGLEDYFLGGWYFREGTFAGPTHGVPVKDALRSTIAMYRIHDQDAIHFQKNLLFQFVNPWKPERLRPFAYSSVSYLYLQSAAGQGPEIPETNELLCWYRVKDTDHQSIP